MKPQTRFYALLGGCVLLLIVAWMFNFSSTIGEWGKNRKLSKELNQLQNAGMQIQMLRQRLAAYADREAFSQERWFEKVSLFCEQKNLQILDLPEAATESQGNYTILQNPVEVEGDFAAMVKMVYLVEQEEQLGRVLHSQIHMVKNREKRKEELHGKIIVQNIE